MPFLTSQTWWVGVLAVTVTLRMLLGLQPPITALGSFRAHFVQA